MIGCRGGSLAGGQLFLDFEQVENLSAIGRVVSVQPDNVEVELDRFGQVFYVGGLVQSQRVRQVFCLGFKPSEQLFQFGLAKLLLVLRVDV